MKFVLFLVGAIGFVGVATSISDTFAFGWVCGWIACGLYVQIFELSA